MTIRRPALHAVCIAAMAASSGTAELAAQDSSIATTTAFVDVAVVPMDRERVIEHQTVLVRDGRIERIGPADVVDVPLDAARVDGRGRYLIPGLADMHVHFVGVPADDDALAKLFIANGVTTAFNLQGGPEHLAMRKRFNTGEAMGPRIYTSGRFVNEPFFNTPEEVEREVVAQKAAGYDFIKMHGDMSREAYARLIEVAGREGIRVVGHAPRNLGVDVLLDERQYGVVHIEEFMYAHFGHHPTRNPQPLDEMDRLIEPLARRVAETKTWVTPTLITYLTITEQIENLESVLARPAVRFVPPSILTRWRRPENTYTQRYEPDAGPGFREAFAFQKRLLGAFHAAGVPLLAGTDAPIPSVVPGFSLHQELKIMVDAGLSPYAALETATRNPAAFFGVLDELGTIEEGKHADLVLLDANPLEDISVTARIAGVMLRGSWLPKDRLDGLLADVASYASTPAAVPARARQLDPVEHHRMRAQASEAIEAERFSEAADLLSRLAASNPRDGSIWLDYARAAMETGRETESLRGLEKAFEIGVIYPRAFVAREIAAIHARRGDRAAALDWLERAIAARWRDRSELVRDTAFASLRDDARFRELAGALPDRPFTRDEGWRYDLDYLVREARRLHKDVERPAFSAEFETTARRLHERIPELSDSEIVIEMRRLLTLLNDGHTGIERGDNATRLPLQFYLFSDGLFIVRADEPAADLVGARVLAFGAASTEAVLDSLNALVPRDNPMGVSWVGPRALTDPVLLKVIGATTDTAAVTLTIRDRDGALRNVTVRAGAGEGIDFSSLEWEEIARILAKRKLPPPFTSSDTTALFLQRVPAAFWFTPLHDIDAVYFQYNQVRPSQGQQTVADFAGELQDALRQTGARNLIVDVRHNSGGNSYTFPPLVRVLAWFQQQSPDHRIYMLIGRNTFSAAQNFTNIVATLIDPLFVGEPTGSSPNFTGESGGFMLPYSGIEANVSFRTHQGTIWDLDPLWIWPDVPVELSSEDYFADRDSVLEAVRALIRADAMKPTP